MKTGIGLNVLFLLLYCLIFIRQMLNNANIYIYIYIAPKDDFNVM